MKRNDYSNYNRGQEISGVTFQQHQNQVIETLNSVMLSLGLDANEKTALWGLQNSGSGSSYNISAGAIFTQGEIFLVDAFSGTSSTNVPVLNPVTLEVGDPVRFADGSIEAVHKDHKYEISMGAEGSGEVNYADLKQLKDVLAVMLDVDAKLNTFKSEIVDGASEGFDTLAEIQAALGDDPDFATNISNQISGKASQLSQDALNTRVTANESVVANIESYRSKGGSNIGTGVTVNHMTSNLQQILATANKTLAFTGTSIPSTDLVVTDFSKPRRILAFFSLLVDKEGGDQDEAKIYIKYRVNGGGWSTLRTYHILIWQPMHLDLKAPVQFTATPAGPVEFALEFERVGSTSFMVTQDGSIAFDYWIN